MKLLGVNTAIVKSDKETEFMQVLQNNKTKPSFCVEGNKALNSI